MYSPKEPEEEVDHLFFDSECDERDTKKEKRVHQEEDRDSTYNKLVNQTENFQVEECALEMLQKEMSKLEVQNRLIAKDSSECKKDIKMRKESSHQEREKKKTKKREQPPKRKGSVKEAKVTSGKVYSNTSSRNSSPFPHSDVSESSQSDNFSSSCSSSSEAEEDDVFKNADDSDHCSEPAKKSTGKFHIWGRSRSSSSSRERSPTPLAKFFNTQSSSPLWRQPQPGSANQKQRPQTSEMADSNDTVTDVTPLSSPDVRRQQLFDLVPPADPLKSVGQQLEANTDGEERSAMLSSGRQLDRMLLVSSPGSTFVSRSSANQHRKNYSFDTSEMRCIERENQRLFRELSRSSTQSSSRFTFRSSAPPLRLYHSGLNRQRQQRRIQQENLAFLKRLESVKPTPGMTRLEQLTDYQRQARYLGIPTLPIRHTSGRNSITCSSSNPHRTRPEIAKPTRITAPRPAWS